VYLIIVNFTLLIFRLIFSPEFLVNENEGLIKHIKADTFMIMILFSIQIVKAFFDVITKGRID
jgi:hypothetical protein